MFQCCFQIHGLCHDFGRSRCLSLFGRCSAVNVTGLLAIAYPFFIFHIFCLVFPHTWFSLSLIMWCVFNPLIPPCLCVVCLSVLTYAHVSLVTLGYVYPFCISYSLCRVLLVRLYKRLLVLSNTCSPAPDFLAATYAYLTDCVPENQGSGTISQGLGSFALHGS